VRRTSQPAVAPDASCQCFKLADSADQFSAGGCCRLRHGRQRTKVADTRSGGGHAPAFHKLIALKVLCHRIFERKFPRKLQLFAPTKPPKEAAGAVLGYGRVSREGQGLAQQRAAVRAAGCARLFEEKASGGCNSTRRSQSSDPR
jgi:hypothetical protein